MPAAFDTNVLAYAAGVGHGDADRAKVSITEALVTHVLSHDVFVIPLQAALELHTVLVRKRRMLPERAAGVVRDYLDAARLISTDFEIVKGAFELAERHRLQTYDAVIVAAAAQGQCEVLYSEDMQHGLEWNGVRIVNPFAPV